MRTNKKDKPFSIDMTAAWGERVNVFIRMALLRAKVAFHALQEPSWKVTFVEDETWFECEYFVSAKNYGDALNRALDHLIVDSSKPVGEYSLAHCVRIAPMQAEDLAAS